MNLDSKPIVACRPQAPRQELPPLIQLRKAMVARDSLSKIYRLLHDVVKATPNIPSMQSILWHPYAEDVLERCSRSDVGENATIAIVCCTWACNLCVAEVSPNLDTNSVVASVLRFAYRHLSQRQILHVSLITISNAARDPLLTMDEQSCRAVAGLAVAAYTVASVVEGFCAAVVNLIHFHPELRHKLLQANALEVLQQLLPYWGDDVKLVTQGIRALVKISANTANTANV